MSSWSHRFWIVRGLIGLMLLVQPVMSNAAEKLSSPITSLFNSPEYKEAHWVRHAILTRTQRDEQRPT